MNKSTIKFYNSLIERLNLDKKQAETTIEIFDDYLNEQISERFGEFMERFEIDLKYKLKENNSDLKKWFVLVLLILNIVILGIIFRLA
jgi:Na+/phosphate symporter